jgi:hypothetical protein
MSNDRISLSETPGVLAKLVGDKAPVPTYREIYSRVLNGQIPAERRNGRWYLSADVIVALAEKARAEVSR